MSLDWRETLKTLQAQFELRAAHSPGLHHLLVEAADNERSKLKGPEWFKPHLEPSTTIGGKLQYRKWDVCFFSTLPGGNPEYRAVESDEVFDEANSNNVIFDQSGIARAVFVPPKQRFGYFCSSDSEGLSQFNSLANAATEALAGSNSLQDHYFASDLTDLFRKPRGGVRYVFGEVPVLPHKFMNRGWDTGVLQYEKGILIDVPISESKPDANHWVLMLHRLGWHQIEGSGLSAQRKAWHENTECTLEMLSDESLTLPEELSKAFAKISKESFYSVLGSKESPLDINLASVFAIQLLLADLAIHASSSKVKSKPLEDYSGELWNNLSLPEINTVSKANINDEFQSKVGIIVATEVERQAVLKKMRPLNQEDAVFQIFSGDNTYYVGSIGCTNIVLCMCSMGAVGRDSSSPVTKELIELWQLKAVIMVGIAFGKDAMKQEIGTVLVSDRVIAYESERVRKNQNEDRGDVTKAGIVLLNRFKNTFGWDFRGPDNQKCAYQFGAILSGEKLVDDLEFKQRLFERYPTAIGGEMEGAGVAASAERARCEWIVVKAICDWGDGTKTKHHQGFAAAAAIDLVEHVLNQPGVLESL